MREGGAGRARAQMCIQERLLWGLLGPIGGSGAPRACPPHEFWALSVGARGPRRGTVGMVVCTSEAMEAVSLGARGWGWEGQSADVHTGEAVGDLSGPRKGLGAPKACPPHEFLGSKYGCMGASEGHGG